MQYQLVWSDLMEASNKALGAILLLYLAVLPTVVAKSDISCKMLPDDPCKFTLSGDTTGTIDLTSVFSNGPLEVKGSGNDYHYEACKGVACDGGKCGNDACVACQKANTNYGIGDIKTVSCNASQSNSSLNKWIIKLSYTGGTGNRKSDFTFTYSPHDKSPEMTFDKEHPSLDYHLTVIADFGVPGSSTPTKPSGSDTLDKVGIVGIVLILLLLVAIVAYIVIGMIINATVRGARGVEMIPNLSFWKDFPYLLKDGFLFTFTCPCLRKKYTSSMN